MGEKGEKGSQNNAAHAAAHTCRGELVVHPHIALCMMRHALSSVHMLLRKRANTSYSRFCVILMSDRVEASISFLDAAGKPRIVYETHAPIDFRTKEKTPAAMLSTALSSACDRVMREALPHIVGRRIGEGHFDSIEIFYGAPWYLSRGRQVIIERGSTAPLTEKALHELIAKNIKGLLPEDMQDIIILEEHARSFTINGYPVEHPIGTTGKELGMRLFVSAIDAATKASVEDTIGRFFHAPAFGHHSTLFSLVQVILGLKKSDTPFLLIDISGNMTEISKVDRGMVLDSVSFPQGFATATEETATALKRDTREVHSIMKRPTDFGLTAEFDTARDAALGRWSEGYARALHDFGTSALPAMTILIADTPLRDSFKREAVRLSGGTVYVIAKDAYLSFYEAAARPYAHTISGLLSLF